MFGTVFFVLYEMPVDGFRLLGSICHSHSSDVPDDYILLQSIVY